MMKSSTLFIIAAVCLWACTNTAEKAATESSVDVFPDGTEISDWFKDTTKLELTNLGTAYNIAEYGAIADDTTILNTEAIQKVIDMASDSGGGVVVVPKGTFMSGALFFKPGTRLHVQEGGMLKGSDDIANYPLIPSRMEGQNLDYYAALVNAYGVDKFSISGKGTIDGNGLTYWKAFWQRRKEDPKCTNLEVSRPRLVFIWDSDDVQIQDINLTNAGFWTTHLYQCNNVKILDAYIYSPKEPIKAPSTDAIDLDVCSNVLIRGCYMSVNDDAVALKGGKGPWADEDPNNGPNSNVLIENNTYGFCHSVLTCGSENINTKNVLMRNCKVDGAYRLLFLKMRPDTPQNFEYITIENIEAKNMRSGIYIRPWTQFFDLQGRETAPVSTSSNITFRNINLQARDFADVGITEHDRLADFTLENMNVEAEHVELDTSLFDGIEISDVVINGEKWPSEK